MLTMIFFLNRLVENNVNQRVDDRLHYGKDYLLSVISNGFLDIKNNSIRLTSDVNMLDILLNINNSGEYNKGAIIQIMADYNTPFIEIYDARFKLLMNESLEYYRQMATSFANTEVEQNKFNYFKKIENQEGFQDVFIQEFFIPRGILFYSVIPIRDQGFYQKSIITNYILIGKIIDKTSIYNLKKVLNQDFEIINKNKVRLLSTRFNDFGESLTGSVIDDEYVNTVLSWDMKTKRQDVICSPSTSDPKIKSLYFPYYASTGDVYVGIINQEVNVIAKDNARPYLLTLTGVVFVLIIIASFLLNREIATPINLLLAGINKVSERLGNNLPFEQIHIRTNDEISTLADAYNQMGINLYSYAHSLESVIDEKTEMNRRLQQFDKLKDDFLANTSHELRTPLSGIIGIADSLLDGAAGHLTKPARQNISLITASTKRLSAMVNDILDFYKLKNLQLELSPKAVDLYSMVHLVLAISTALAAKKDISLINEVPRDLPPVEADEHRLEQILYNLVGNAIKFTEQGEVRVLARQEGDTIRISVADTGIGIPEDKKELIFNSFEQISGSADRRYGGAGLGLAITKQLVELHQSCIEVESEVGKGSVFSFCLPESDKKVETEEQIISTISDYYQDEIDLYEKKEDFIVYQPPPGEPGQKILVVDDEMINVQMLDNMLTIRNYQVIKASSGFEALEYIGSHKLPDLVLVDVMMPGMSGLELCETLRNEYSATELPIILLTAKTRVVDLVSGFKSGANDYLTKPFSKDELLSRIETQLKLVEQQKKIKDNERIKKELEIAHQIQNGIISLPSQKHDDLHIVAEMRPAETVGGDYYDVLYDSQENLWFAIGDVSGHGVIPGLIMMMAQSSFSSVIHENNNATPQSAINSVNKFLYHNINERLQKEHFMTMTFLKYLGEGDFLYSGAHVPIILYRAEENRCELIETTGCFLGMIPDISGAVNNSQFTLNRGDLLVLYTDGIIEARSSENKLYDLPNFQKVICRHGKKPLDVIKDYILQEVMDWCGNNPKDDITLVLARRK